MRRPLTLLILCACACSSGSSGGSSGGSGGGTDGTSVTRGVITRTGSATVGGTTFDTDAAEVERDDQPAMAGEFFLGEDVTIEGTRADALTGVAQRVVYDDDIEGPISSIDDVEFALDGATVRVSELTILDQTVEVERGLTVFDGIDFDTLAPGDLVEISGLRAGAAFIVATRLRLVEAAAVAPFDVELKGTLENLDEPGGTFDIGAIQVLFDGTTVLDGFPGEVPMLMEDDFVEVEGVFDGAISVDTRNGGRIELEDPAIEGDLADLQVEGIVSDFSSLFSEFRVGGQRVDADPSRLDLLFEPSTRPFVEDGARIEVEGPVTGGLLVANRVRLRDAEVSIAAAIADADADVDADAGTLVLLGAIEVEVDAATRLDGFDALDELMTLDFLEVRGLKIREGVVRATRIGLEQGLRDVELRARVDGIRIAVFRFFEILQLRIEVDDDTDFVDFPLNLPDPEDNFFQYITSGDTNALLGVLRRVVDPLDATSLTVADEVQLEE
jgi:hypothetical protein